MHSGGTVYTTEEDGGDNAKGECGFPRMRQSLLLLLFVQHADPFSSQLSDIMGDTQL